MKSITADIKGLLIQSKISKKAGYKRANSFCPLRESKESVRDDGSVFINDICYSEKYPNSFFDVFYFQRDAQRGYSPIEHFDERSLGVFAKPSHLVGSENAFLTRFFEK